MEKLKVRVVIGLCIILTGLGCIVGTLVFDRYANDLGFISLPNTNMSEDDDISHIYNVNKAIILMGS